MSTHNIFLWRNFLFLHKVYVLGCISRGPNSKKFLESMFFSCGTTTNYDQVI